MKAYLFYEAYKEIELPDIGPNTVPFQSILKQNKEIALSELPEGWIIKFVDVLE